MDEMHSMWPSNSIGRKAPSAQRTAGDPNVLAGLGKSTRRGLKKCPNCSSMNGTKAVRCKNKSCNVVLRDTAAQKTGLTDACRLDTGNITRVYSVRVRDSNPEQRGFVQLQNDSTGNNSLCFVDQCHGNFMANVLQCHERGNNKKKLGASCEHMGAALQSTARAVPLPVNLTVLNALAISPETKLLAGSLVTDFPGPAVQRVSRNVMAVRNSVTHKFPLGYVHCMFRAGRPGGSLLFSCPCREFSESTSSRCIHIYLCICAFVNHDTLRQEFQSYIRLELSLAPPTSQEVFTADDKPEVVDDLTPFLDCHVEVLDDNMAAILGESAILRPHEEHPNDLLTDAIIFSSDDLDPSSQDKYTIEMPLSDTELEPLDLPAQSHDLSVLIPDVMQQDLLNEQLLPFYMEPQITPLISPPILSLVGGGDRVALSFASWLSSVTESVNQRMHYQLSGSRCSLAFQAPSKFWIKFRERLLKHSDKRTERTRIQPTVHTTTRDTAPIGTFTTYSYSLRSRRHVTSLLQTPQVPLSVEQTFVRLKNGSYQFSECSSFIGTTLYKTKLLVDSSHPFKVDWTPDILPLSGVGHLRLSFKYSHTPEKS